MENNTVQAGNETLEKDAKTNNITIKKQKLNTTIPLIINIIGIFCYLGVIIPSIFKPSSGFLNYTTFDIILMIGGASLIALGSFFWFKAKAMDLIEDEKKALDAA